MLSEAEEWSFDEELAQLEVEMKSVADVFRKDETTKMINGVEVSCPFLVLLFLAAANDAIDRGRSRRNSRSQLNSLLINLRLICGTGSSLGLTT